MEYLDVLMDKMQIKKKYGTNLKDTDLEEYLENLIDVSFYDEETILYNVKNKYYYKLNKNEKNTENIKRYEVTLDILSIIYKYLYNINKINKESNVKFFYNNTALYYLIFAMLDYEYEINKPLTQMIYYPDVPANNYININEFKLYVEKCSEEDKDKNEQLKDISNAIDKLINKWNEVKNLEISKIYYLNFINRVLPKDFIKENNLNQTFNNYDDKKLYSINDFLLAFTIYYMNINDICKFFTYKTDKSYYQNGKIKYTINTDISSSTGKKLKFDNYTIVEAFSFVPLLKTDNDYNLSLITLINCKHIIYHLSKTPLSGYLSKIVLMNFLSTFEKHIIKIIRSNNLKELSSLKENVKLIFEKQLPHNYLYDFDFFIELLYYIQSNKHEINKDIGCKNEKIFEILKNPDINKILSGNINKSDHEQINIFGDIINTLIKTTDLFSNLFINLYANKKITELLTLEKYNIIKKNIYNSNYINLKKPYKFVRDFNNLNFYNNYIFKNITTVDIENYMYVKVFDETVKKYINKSFYDNFISNPYNNPRIILNDSKSLDHKFIIIKDCLYSLIFNKLISLKNYYYHEFSLHIGNEISYDDLCITFNYFFTALVNYINNNFTIEDSTIPIIYRIRTTNNDYENNKLYEFKNPKKNIFIKLSVLKKVENKHKLSHHHMSININFEKGYIDIYNPWGMKYNYQKNIYGNISELIEKYFKENFKAYLDEKLINFKYYTYNTMMKTQSEYEDFYNGFCETFGLIYNFIRINYFNNQLYSMNYIQEMINEYIMSYNHPLYFLFNFVLFTHLEYCNIFCKENKIEKINSNYYYKAIPLLLNNEKFEYALSYFKDNPSEFYKNYRSLMVNNDKIEVICNNYAKIFKLNNIENITNNNRYNKDNSNIDNLQQYNQTLLKNYTLQQPKIFIKV